MKTIKLIMLLLVVCVTYMHAQFAGGNGNANSPYQIENYHQLTLLNNYLGSNYSDTHFILTKDIDFAPLSITWNPIGNDENPFEAKFNGNGKRIMNIHLSIGFFDNIGQLGEIKNLGIENAYASSGKDHAILATTCMGKIETCYVSGFIQGLEPPMASYKYWETNNIGGMVAILGNTGIVINCYSNIEISSQQQRVGGLVGINRGIIKNSYVSGYLSVGSQCANSFGCGVRSGGLAANTSGIISHCVFAAEDVSSVGSGGFDHDTSYSGHISGNYNPSGTYEFNYYNDDLSPIYGKNGSPAPLSDLHTKKFYTDLGWDFDNIWTMPPSGTGLPILRQVSTTPTPINGFAGGTGTATDPFLIATPDQLYLLNNYLGDKGVGKYFKLIQDIDMYDLTIETIECNNWVTGWLPIGVNECFNGTLNGNKKSIKNLWMNRPYQKYMGLFGHLGTKAVVSDLCIEDADIEADLEQKDLHRMFLRLTNGSASYKSVYQDENRYVGILAGRNSGKIERCCVGGYVSAEGTQVSVGGLVGENEGGTILDCYSTCKVIGDGYSAAVGGLVGFDNYGSIQNCYASGDVVSYGTYAGGLVGFNARSSISQSAAANSRVEDLFSKETTNAHRIVGYNDNATGLLTENIAFGGMLVNGNTVTGNLQNREGIDKTIAELYDKATYTNASWNFNSIWKMSSALPVFIWQTGIAPAISGTDATPAIPNQQETFCGGNGTKENPFQICNAAQLASLNNYPGVLGEGKYFIVMNDIDLTSYINANNSDGKGWLPIGNDSFNGHLDGNDKTIKGLWFNRPDEDYTGLFAYLGSGGEIKNLSIETTNKESKGKKYVGILAGKSDGKISSCNTGGIVSGYSVSSDFLDAFIGGVVGYTSGTGSIEKCNSVCKVSATGYSAAVGGVVGFSDHTIIDACNFAGEVITSGKGSYAGGIVGFARKYNTVKNCFATAISINGKDIKNTHRIAGYNDFPSAQLENNNALATTLVNGSTVTSNIGSETVEGFSAMNAPIRAAFNMALYAKYQENETTSLKEEKTSALNIYPNPVEDILTITSTIQSDNGIRLFDLAGKLINVYNAENGSTSIDVSGLTKGVYVLKIDGVTLKVVKK